MGRYLKLLRCGNETSGNIIDQFLNISCPKPGHGELCRQLSITRCQERLQRYTPPPYGVPGIDKASLDTLLPFLFNDKEFYQGRLYASNARLSLDLRLWEGIGMIPDDYMVLCDMLGNPNGTISRAYDEHPQRSAAKVYSNDRVCFVSLCDLFTTRKD